MDVDSEAPAVLRARSEETADQVADRLLPFCANKNFLFYSEKKVSGGDVEPT